MENRTTKSLHEERASLIKMLETFEYIEKNLQPGEKINERNRYKYLQSLLHIEKELINRGENIIHSHFTIHHFPNNK
jgi:hypothetical protein